MLGRGVQGAGHSGLPGVRGFAEAQFSVEDDTASPVPAPLGLAL